ncbi:MAG: Ig-like domain-containing protein [Bacteroidota bacterium]
MPGCANIIPPSGGPRDSLPPILEKANPGDSTRNFSGNRITFSFNEFIELQNPQQYLVLSPLPKTTPEVNYRLNTLTVKLKDSLEANTTYTLNFGEAIKDFTEGNVLKNFTYTFSTGSYIDSLELRGKVILAETGKTDTTLIVMLHTGAGDSAVVKERPRYITKLDSKGNFVFKNLPPRTFYLYALKDDGGTRRYFDDKQLFAFADKPVVTSLKKDTITLYAYSARPAPSLASVLSSVNLGGRSKPKKESENRLRYQTNLSNGQQDLLGNLTISFDDPLRLFDSLKIRLFTDSVFTPASGYHFEKDSSNRIITLVQQWKENTQYQLIMDKGFAEDSSGKKLLKTDTLNFKTKKLADYGSLKIKLKNLDLSLNPVLFILTGETILRSFPMTSPEVSQPLFLPGEYDLRILYDLNKNGKWDPGEFFGKHKQPEIVKPIERKIAVKPNFQNEFEITL